MVIKTQGVDRCTATRAAVLAAVGATVEFPDSAVALEAGVAAPSLRHLMVASIFVSPRPVVKSILSLGQLVVQGSQLGHVVGRLYRLNRQGRVCLLKVLVDFLAKNDALLVLL